MIPPQVNGATEETMTYTAEFRRKSFPMIPPQVNGATAWGDGFDVPEPSFQ